MNNYWNYMVWGNTMQQWFTAIVIIAACIIAAKLIQRIVVTRIKKAAARTESSLDDFIVSVIQRFAMPLTGIFSVYWGVQYLTLPSKLQQVLHVAILFVSVFFVVRMITTIIRYFFLRFTQSRSDEQVQVKQAKGILLIINIIVWIIAIIFMIDNLGYSITTIVTGLGIGGVAIALAAQAILGDLFSYLVIFFDKPFETGDFIIIGDKMGTIEYIGVKTTRLRALSGEQLIVSNTDLTNSRVQNYKRMEKRRVVYTIRVVYETHVEQLKKIPGMIRRVIELQPDVQLDRVHFSGFGQFSLDFEIVYYISSADYNLYMDRQQAINIAIIESFEKANITFAYPTQKLLLHSQAHDREEEVDESRFFNGHLHDQKKRSLE